MTGVRLGGVLASLPMLLKEGFVSVSNRLLQLPNGYCGLTAILLLLAFMTLARVRNPESLRYSHRENGAPFSAWTGDQDATSYSIEPSQSVNSPVSSIFSFNAVADDFCRNV